VYVLAPYDRGENVAEIACSSSEGKFLPQIVILKRVNNNQAFWDRLPQGPEVHMNPKSPYINSVLFLKLFRENFIPNKPSGKCFLVLEGHAFHCKASELLELADSHDIAILSLPSYTTQAPQLLGLFFFKPRKNYCNQKSIVWMRNHKERNTTRYQVAELTGKAWGNAAHVSHGSSGCKVTGIFRFDANVIPNHFSTANNSATSREEKEPQLPASTLTESREPEPSVSTATDGIYTKRPSKHLLEISPVPKILTAFNKRMKQSATILLSQELINRRKVANEKNRTRNTLGSKKPETKAEQRKTPEES
jgi:hypothetical protein